MHKYQQTTSSDSFVIQPEKNEHQDYVIPLRYRKMENMHIVFWILKDISWCLTWRPLGLTMILPTFVISLVIAWRTKEYFSQHPALQE